MPLRTGCLLFASFLAMTSGVVLGSADPPITLDQLPPEVRMSITRVLGEKPAIKTIKRALSDGQTVFEVKAKRAGGFDVDLRLAEDGAVLKKEEEIPLAELPAAVRTNAERILGSVPVHEAKKVTKGNRVRYEIEHYDAKHGYAVDDSDAYNAAAASRHYAALSKLYRIDTPFIGYCLTP